MPKLFENIDISAQTTYPTTPQVLIEWDDNTSWLIINEATDVECYFSFDGQIDHGKLKPSSYPGVGWETPEFYKKLWLRRAVVGGLTAKITVMAGELPEG